MEYSVHGKWFSYEGLKKYLIKYCYDYPNGFYRSRKFGGILGQNGKTYEASVVFNRSAQLKGFFFKKGQEHQIDALKQYAYELEDTKGSIVFFDTKEKLINFLEKTCEVHYILKCYKTGKTFGVKYFPERQELEVNRKPYSINVFKS